MKTNITCNCKKCGAEFQRVVYASAEKEIEWAKADSLCRDCWYAEKKAAEAAEKSEKIAVFGEMPALTGTPKQIRWAEDIRREALVKLAEFMETSKRQPKNPAETPIAMWLRSHTEARWYIDGHDDFPLIACGKLGSLTDDYKQWLSAAKAARK